MSGEVGGTPSADATPPPPRRQRKTAGRSRAAGVTLPPSPPAKRQVLSVSPTPQHSYISDLVSPPSATVHLPGPRGKRHATRSPHAGRVRCNNSFGAIAAPRHAFLEV